MSLVLGFKGPAIVKLGVLGIVFGLSAAVFADGNSGVGKISHLYQRSSDGLLGIYKENGSWNNPDGCDSSSRIVLQRSNPARSEFYASILATKMSGSDFSAWTSGCVDWNGSTYPNVTGVYTH